MLAYVFERFPKFTQTFCYREVAEMFRQGVRPAVFSLRQPDPELRQPWAPEIVSAVHQLPEGDEFARLADKESAHLSREIRKTLKKWRGKRDSLRLHQAVYLGPRLRALGVTHVHVHFAGMAARTAWWLREFFGFTYSLTVHANDVLVADDFQIGLPEIFASASAIMAVSDHFAEYLRERFPAVAARVHRVYNGIDSSEFQPARFTDPPLILSIGRLVSIKGFDLLIAACALMRERNFRCEIIGGGPLREELAALISDLGARVQLRGAQSQAEIRARLAAASVFALPCRVDAKGGRDNLPTVFMEAMAAGLPIISTDIGGVREMVVDGVTGHLVATENAQALADAICRLLDQRDEARKLGAAGRERCAKMFAIENSVRELREIFAALPSR
ncbi:MAG: glycosyltransferase family 4 protein [Verrucomicrobiota bacterium]|nr:glycosyltransferase family 4 protein [Verrucomicrobiota bacterium]